MAKKVKNDTVKAVKEVKDEVKAKVKPSKPKAEPKPKKDPAALSEKQEKALALIKKGTTKESFISQMGIEVSGYGGLIGNMRRKGILVECGKDGKLSIGK